MSVNIILQNAIAQLEAQKAKKIEEASNVKAAELKADFESYKQQKQAEYDEAVATLKMSFDATIAAKQAEISAQVSTYASTQAILLDKKIEQLKQMLADGGDD